jgi:hypothetical protein
VELGHDCHVGSIRNVISGGRLSSIESRKIFILGCRFKCDKHEKHKPPPVMRLLDHTKNIYSQCGEDGILAKILEILPSKDRWCVEFGAWDGKYMSNTCNLIEHSGYSTVLIEPNKNKCDDLCRRYATKPDAIILNKFVGFTPQDNLDALLAGKPIPKDFDVLSIDIDGNDYHVWNAIVNYTPKVVCIEFNPSIPTEVDFVQVADPKVSHGSSLLAFARLGRQKGYELVCVTQLNAIFVWSTYFSLFGISNNAPNVLREDVSLVTNIFSGYDGTLFISGCDYLPWHLIPYQKRIRQLPRFFRSYPGNFNRLKTKLFSLYRKL